MKYVFLALTFLVGLSIWYCPAPEGVSEQAWHLFAIFVATIFGVITSPLPMGAMAFIGLAAIILTNTLSWAVAFSGFSHHIVWLIVFAFFVARGFIKTGLGLRISYHFLARLGKTTLGLGYGIAATDLILAPAIPSNTARAGGVVLPIMEALSKTFNSEPHKPSARRMGSYLSKVAIQTTAITSAMFLTSMAANPLIAEIASGFGIEITWTSWALAASVPGLINLLIIPPLIYLIYPPEIKKSPNAALFANEKLRIMGKMSLQEWIMLATFIVLIALWIIGPKIHLLSAATALFGLVVLLITGVLTWHDVRREESAWETLVWFAVLLMMATQLTQLGLTEWVSQQLVAQVQGMPWMSGLLVLSITYYYSHYLFASLLAHVGSMYATFLIIAISLGAPPALAALIFAFLSSLFSGLTQYSSGPAALFFGAGYVRIWSWWKVGFIVSVVNMIVWICVGGLWWKVLGLW